MKNMLKPRSPRACQAALGLAGLRVQVLEALRRLAGSSLCPDAVALQPQPQRNRNLCHVCFLDAEEPISTKRFGELGP